MHEGSEDKVRPHEAVDLFEVLERIEAVLTGQTAWSSFESEMCASRRGKRYAPASDQIIVINRVNSPECLGKSAIISTMKEKTVFESNMMRFSLNDTFALPEYVIERAPSD